jgi:hypothetical protein
MNAVISEATRMWLISANDLLLGDVVYLSGQSTWTRELTGAEFFISEQAAEQARIQAESQSNQVIGPIVVAASWHASDQRVELDHYRDRFRESGPTHRKELSRPFQPASLNPVREI